MTSKNKHCFALRAIMQCIKNCNYFFPLFHLIYSFLARHFCFLDVSKIWKLKYVLLLLLLFLLISMLLISMSIDLWKIICTSSLVRLINCRFHLFRYSASSFSSQYLILFLSHQGAVLFFFFFRHLSFNYIMKTIYSQNMTNSIGFST